MAYIENEPKRAYMKGHCQRIQVRRCLLLSAFLGRDKDDVNHFIYMRHLALVYMYRFP